MMQTAQFPSAAVKFYFQLPLQEVLAGYGTKDVVFITNEHIARLYPAYFANRKTLVIPAGEHTKDMATIATLAKGLLNLEISRGCLLVGVGGGVVTDITGFLASVYMRGVPFGFVPTTLLGMVDAAIGGKNGVNLDLNKNILGTFCHPDFILYDYNFLRTLPSQEWSNGFAEIIKYACIFDKDLFASLAQNYISYYKEDPDELYQLVELCAAMKIKTVCEDEKEKGTRKLLNFGHTAGHAIETLYELPHGYAVAIGMVIASMVSEKITGLPATATASLVKLLGQYYLPTSYAINPQKVMELLKMDKKREQGKLGFALLDEIGKASLQTLSFETIEATITEYASNHQPR